MTKKKEMFELSKQVGKGSEGDFFFTDDSHDGEVYRAAFIWENGLRIEVSHPKMSSAKEFAYLALKGIVDGKKVKP